MTEPTDLPPTRLPASETEAAVCQAVTALLQDKARLLDAAPTASPATRSSLLEAADACLARCQDAQTTDQEQQIRTVLHRVEVLPDHLRITLDLREIAGTIPDDPDHQIIFDTPVRVNQNGRTRPIVVRTGLGEAKPDADLIARVADARRWMKALTDGTASSASDITEREGLRSGMVSLILRLAWHAPDIASAILAGHQPAGLSAKRLRELPDLPLDWAAQRRVLGFPAR